MDVNEVLLPGVGLRYDFTTADGDHVGIVAGRNGSFEIVSAVGDDPDEVRPLFRLRPDEASAVAEILGAPRIAERFADLTREVPGLNAAQIEVPPDSPFAGRPLGDTRARTRTGASVVAVVRADAVIPSPGPDEEIRSGDILVVIGTHDGLTAVERLIQS